MTFFRRRGVATHRPKIRTGFLCRVADVVNATKARQTTGERRLPASPVHRSPAGARSAYQFASAILSSVEREEPLRQVIRRQ